MDEPGKTRTETEFERFHQKSEFRESWIIVVQAVIALCAAAGLGWRITGHHVWAPAWITATGVLAVAVIYAQRMIRFLRCAHRDAQAYIALLHAQIEEILSSWPHDGSDCSGG